MATLESILPTAIRSELLGVSERLDRAGIPWAIFAGTAAAVYGSGRPITDLDILIRTQDRQAVIALFPEAAVTPETIRLQYIELVPLDDLAFEGAFYSVRLDDEMLSRRTFQSLGRDIPLLSAEDNIVFKALLQRGPEQGKHDLTDIQAMADNRTLDLEYLMRRAEACGARERVWECLRRLRIVGQEGVPCEKG